jgi:hypothetical protein
MRKPGNVNAAWLSAALALLPLSAWSDDDVPDCTKVACRAARTVDMIFGQNELRFAVPASPYLTSDGHIVIFPGERLVYRFPFTADHPGTPEFVREEAVDSADGALKDAPPGTLVLSYGQFTGNGTMTLTLQHNLPATLKLKAFMSVPGPDGFKLVYTSTCPVLPKVIGMENWQQPLGLIILEDFKFQNPAATTMSCE